MFELLAIGVPVVMAVGGGYLHLWVKTATNSQEVAGLRELINERFDNVEQQSSERQADTHRRLERIERAMNGAIKDH
jgi:hypothetical protein